MLGYIWSNDFSNDHFLESQLLKAKRIFHFLMRQLKTTEREVLVKAYTLYCRPIMEYVSPLLGEMTRVQKRKVESLQRNIVAYIYNRATMTTQDDLEATINIQQLEEEESEEYYSQNINSVESQGREVKEQGSQKVSNSNVPIERKSYEEKLLEFNLMPLTKRLARNILYTIQAALNEDLFIPGIVIDQLASQRLGPKIVVKNCKSKSKRASKVYNTFFTVTGARAFNNLRPEIRKVYTNKESFKTKLEFLLQDIEVLSNSVPLQRLSLLNQIRSYNDKYHNQFETS